ncbi:MAG: hypothetical protein K0R18_199 [Bacillales bacterium]|jgi:hypothetical protein|nr:hypothetical protein [Bacillales bacterium]
MKRLIRKANELGTFTFAQVREYIGQKTPNVLFGLNLEEQEKLGTILDLFEGAVKEAADYSGLGMPQLEVGVANYDNIAYYKLGSGILTINEGSFDQLFNATNDYIEMVGVHEYGHYVDEKLGNISETDGWKEIINKSTVNYLEGYGITATTDKPAEQFANVFIACVWGATDDECTQFINNSIRGN